jgi:integrase/recombinase XerD
MGYLKQWQQTYNKQLCKDYIYHIQIFTKEASFTILTATYKDIVAYITIRRKLGDSIYILKNKVASIKKYYQCLIDLEIITDHPCKHLVLKDKQDTRIDLDRLYSGEELASFLARKNIGNKALAIRNQLLRSFLVHQALTVSEIGKLKVSDIDLDTAMISITDIRELEVNPKQMLTIYRYIEEYRDDLLKGKQTDILLVSRTGKPLDTEHINYIVNKGFEKRFMPKLIRQSVIYNLLKKGKDLRSVQLFAGHKSILTTEQYRNTNFEELKSQLQLKHPLNHL